MADAYHAMVHERPYKSALTHAQALAELRRHASSQFDPTVVEVFIAIFGDEVPSDGLEEIHRLHEHAEGGLAGMDPKAAALLRSDRFEGEAEDATEPGPPKPMTSRGSGIASYVVRSAWAMFTVTGPVTVIASACRGEATRRAPKRSAS